MPSCPSFESTPPKVLTPKQYLDLAASGTPLPADHRGFPPLVNGRVNLASHPGGMTIRSLPSAEIVGDLLAVGCRSLEKVDCVVRGDAILNRSGVREFGPSFRVGGELRMQACNRLECLEGDFPSSVELSESSVRRLGARFSCAGSLSVSSCPLLENLDCRVRGSVFAQESSLAALGPNFACFGDLRLEGCRSLSYLGIVAGPPNRVDISCSAVEEVGPSFSCRGDLVAADMPRLRKISGSASGSLSVSSAPRLVSVSFSARRSLSLSNCPALRTVEFSTNGSVSLHKCSMDKIAPHSSGRGELSLVACHRLREIELTWSGSVVLVDLPEIERVMPSFACEGSLMVRSCPSLRSIAGRVGNRVDLVEVPRLEEIGHDLEVGGDMTVSGSSSSLRVLGCSVAGALSVMGPNGLESTAPSFRVGGSLLLRRCATLKVVRGLVEGTVEIREGCSVERLGADFECGGDLVLMDGPCPLRVNCRVAGDVVVERWKIEGTGPAFSCGGAFTVT